MSTYTTKQFVTGHPLTEDKTETELRLVRVDKIASSTVNLGLNHELEITARCEARAGNVVVVRTLTDNATYNTLELVTGRMAKINPGGQFHLRLRSGSIFESAWQLRGLEGFMMKPIHSPFVANRSEVQV